MNTLQEQILQLSVADRLQLISFIAESLSPEAVQSTFELPAAWVEEALARDAAYASGRSQGYTWDEVKDRVHGKK